MARGQQIRKKGDISATSFLNKNVSAITRGNQYPLQSSAKHTRRYNNKKIFKIILFSCSASRSSSGLAARARERKVFSRTRKYKPRGGAELHPGSQGACWPDVPLPFCFTARLATLEAPRFLASREFFFRRGMSTCFLRQEVVAAVLYRSTEEKISIESIYLIITYYLIDCV